MTPITQARNYQGQMRKIRKPRPVIVALAGEGSIIWSTTPKRGVHTVQYGLQTRDFRGSLSEVRACEEFSSCVLHHEATESNYLPESLR